MGLIYRIYCSSPFLVNVCWLLRVPHFMLLPSEVGTSWIIIKNCSYFHTFVIYQRSKPFADTHIEIIMKIIKNPGCAHIDCLPIFPLLYNAYVLYYDIWKYEAYRCKCTFFYFLIIWTGSMIMYLTCVSYIKCEVLQNIHY